MKRRTFLGKVAGAAAAAGCPKSFAGPATDPDNRLGQHRVDAITFQTVRLTWPRLVGKNARLDVHGRGPAPRVCVLRTDQGASGWGMIRGNDDSVRDIADLVRGKPVSELISPATGIASRLLEPLDFALHDLAGVILEQPVWRMIGGARPVITKVYSGMIYFDDLEPPDRPAGIGRVLEECRWDYDYGYRQFKCKIGRGNKWMPPAEGLRRDVEVIRAVADAFPDVEILVDANNGYTAETAIAFLDGLDGIPLFWFEEPFHETVEDWRKLYAWMRDHGYAGTYRADGEYGPDAEVLDVLCRERVVNLRLEDILGHGFTRWRGWLPELTKQGVAASPHTWGEGLKTVYVAHLAAALGNVPTIEGVTCSHDDVDFGENRVEGGKFLPSSEAGFGLKLRTD